MHRKIFEALEKLIYGGLLANPITLKNYFEKEKDDLNIPEYLVKITKFSTSSRQALEYSKLIFDLYVKKQKKIDIKKFKNDFEILSILRNLKIIGIFTRLALRDGKKKYLRLIPYTWRLIELRINENKVFDDLKILLNQNFRGKFNAN